MTLEEEIEYIIETVINPGFERHSNLHLREVGARIERIDTKTGLAVLSLTLGKDTNCSPFCGCAANELIRNVVSPAIKNRVPWVTNVMGKTAADIPFDLFEL